MGTLDGVRVLEAGLLVQGPQAALTMLEWGADVIKVELPGFGDQSRWLPISREDRRSAFFGAYNRGKRSVTVDLRVPQGREVFLRLVEQADVVITNFKPGTMEDWGLGYADLAERNPRLVYAVGSSFGRPRSRCRPRGGRSQRPGCGRPHQHDRREGERPEPHRGDGRGPHLRAEPACRDPRRAVRQGAHRSGPDGRDLAARRPDLGPGRRIHPVPDVGATIGTEWTEPPDDPRHLRHVRDL